MNQLHQAIKSALPTAMLDFLFRLRDVGRYWAIRQKYGDASWLSDLIAAIGAQVRPTKTILFFPERPAAGRVEYQACAMLGYAITLDPRRRYDVAFKRMDATFFDPRILQPVSAPAGRILNAGSIDISKHKIAEMFAAVFGYELEVDPTCYHGPMVIKSNLNFAHNGRVIQGPLPPVEIRSGYVYQKAIDNHSEHEGLILDLRTPIYGGQCPLVFLKHRPIEKRFLRPNTLVELAEPQAVFTKDELARLGSLTKRLGVDYGELDVLRDRDGRIYVVDVNTTPGNLPLGLSEMESKKGMRLIVEAFRQLIEAEIS